MPNHPDASNDYPEAARGARVIPEHEARQLVHQTPEHEPGPDDEAEHRRQLARERRPESRHPAHNLDEED